MFTGLIEETGSVASAGKRLVLEAPRIGPGTREGDSVAVNGCCLTVIECNGSMLGFDLLEETLARTNLGRLKQGGIVNLERALGADGRMGGHFVQGHIDCVTEALSFGTDHRLEVALPEAFARYVAFKGSVALDGISLTVAELLERSFVVCIIPHTLAHTNLASLRAGDAMNLECDILAKYVERAMGEAATSPRPGASRPGP